MRKREKGFRGGGFGQSGIILLFIALCIAGCGSASVSSQQKGSGAENSGLTEDAGPEGADDMGSEQIAELYRDIYEKAESENTLGSLAVTQDIVDRLGEYGYAAIDGENHNQVNMTHPELIEAFCRQAEAGEDGQAVFFCVGDDGGFIRFDLETSDGKVSVTRTVLNWAGGMPEVGYTGRYEAHDWTCTENGYLFFDEYHPAGYDGAPGYTAVRIKYLDDACRDMNRRYIFPIGYGSNNMFLTDWDEDDFGGLDFGDLFPKLYPLVYERPIPYERTYDGQSYRVPETEFEDVIGSYFEIDAQTLRAGADYLEQERVYLYRTRGFNDNGATPNTPYPEVTACEENGDGTVSLTVHAVWPARHLDRAFCHQVVVRPLEDGSFRYVSNRVIPSEDNAEAEWYEEKVSYDPDNIIIG